EVIVFVPESVIVFAAAVLKRRLFVLLPDVGALLVVTFVLLPAAQVSLTYEATASGVIGVVPEEPVIAQSVPLTVAKPPRMPLTLILVPTVMALPPEVPVYDCVPAGGVKSTLPPICRCEILPSLRSTFELPPVVLSITTA